MRLYKVCSLNDRTAWLDTEACSAARAAEWYARNCFLSKHTTIKACLVIAVATEPRHSRLYLATPFKVGNGFGSWVVLGALEANLTLAYDLPVGYQFLNPYGDSPLADELDGPSGPLNGEVGPEVD